MEIGKQIRKFRTEMELSQDGLAEKIFVSRQTISNWENDKNYPDVKSLVLLSSLFGVSLDILIKGDIEKMKERIKPEDIKRVKRNSRIMQTINLAIVLLSMPLLKLFIVIVGNWYVFFVVYVLLGIGAIVLSFRVEKFKKNLDIHTYKEMLAFLNGKELNEAEKNQEYGKRKYQTILTTIGYGLFALAVQVIWLYVLFNLF